MTTKLIKFELMQKIETLLADCKNIIANEADVRMVNNGANDEHTAHLYRAVNRITDTLKSINALEGADQYIAGLEKRERMGFEVIKAQAKKWGGCEFVFFHTTGRKITINSDGEMEAAMQELNRFNQDSITEGI